MKNKMYNKKQKFIKKKQKIYFFSIGISSVQLANYEHCNHIICGLFE